jgi:DNA repair photolyase
MPLIYQPAGRAREYAALACNIYRGCDHACTYCYAPDATFRQRDEFAHPSTRPDFIRKLTSEAERTSSDERILLCFTCDPYQTLDESAKLTRQTIKVLHAAGLSVQVLTKGGTRALRDLSLFTPRDAFATTLTLTDDACSLKWEPGAALPSDRIATIRLFHEAGIPTWVSLEPVLNPVSALELIRRTHEFVDLFKVGTLNHHPLSKSIDWRKFATDAVALLTSLGKPYYIKDDLRAYLPAEAQVPSH